MAVTFLGGTAVSGYFNLHRTELEFQSPDHTVPPLSQTPFPGATGPARIPYPFVALERDRLCVLAFLKLRELLLEQICQRVVIPVLLKIRAGIPKGSSSGDRS